MEYGALLTNQNDSSIVGAGEQTYLYWGKIGKSVVGTNYFNDAQEITLFNIPSSYDVIVYSYSTGDDVPIVIVDTTSGLWKARVYINGIGKNATVYLYVFVQARYISLPKYGAVVYDDSGNVQWHTGRPCLNFKDYRFDDNASTVLIPQPVTGYQPLVQVGTPHASSMIFTTPPSQPFPSYDGYIWHYYAQRTSSGIMRHGFKSSRIIGNDAGYFKGEYYSNNQNDLPVAYITIEAGFYDQFPSLGNA